MTPKEKAKELFDKMYIVKDPMGNYPMCFDTAKQCALIAVNEIIIRTISVDTMPYNCQEIDEDTKEYWQEVKQEIENL